MQGERAILKSWTDGFVDRDNKIITEFQQNFHSAFWEFFLHKNFKEQGFKIDFSKGRPDFIIKSPAEIFVEAVTANISQSGRKEPLRGANDILSMIEPPWLQQNFAIHMNEAIVRNSNALLSKVTKLKDYLDCSWVNPDAPFIIALGSYGQVNYGREFYFPLLALLYGWYYDPSEREYFDKSNIDKPGTTSQINLALFNEERFNNVSAILFSCSVTLGKLTSLAISADQFRSTNQVFLIREFEEWPFYRMEEITPETPESIFDGVFIFHNPNARIKLPISVFDKSGMVQITMEDGSLNFSGKRRSVYSRLNLPSMFLNEDFKQLLIDETHLRFNCM
jgi:hypothetical protein